MGKTAVMDDRPHPQASIAAASGAAPLLIEPGSP
jgi:hypothetical protein